jgi:hypothetical protein
MSSIGYDQNYFTRVFGIGPRADVPVTTNVKRNRRTGVPVDPQLPNPMWSVFGSLPVQPAPNAVPMSDVTRQIDELGYVPQVSGAAGSKAVQSNVDGPVAPKASVETVVHGVQQAAHDALQQATDATTTAPAWLVVVVVGFLLWKFLKL